MTKSTNVQIISIPACVLDFGISNFEIVSDFDIRISDFS